VIYLFIYLWKSGEIGLFLPWKTSTLLPSWGLPAIGWIADTFSRTRSGFVVVDSLGGDDICLAKKDFVHTYVNDNISACVRAWVQDRILSLWHPSPTMREGNGKNPMHVGE
jgi:hypothetical protein